MASPASYRPAPGTIPTQPGVYRFRDRRGRVIYVGKAKNLRARLSSYFQDISNLHPRTASMVTTGASVEWTVVRTEVEALQLEYSWIKEFDPRFNVKYRDDKSYPWLAVTVGEEFPRVMVGRGAKKKGTRYFGPYGHAWAIRETVDLLLRVFPHALVQQRGLQALRADRPPLPARLHRQVRGALRRRRERRGAPTHRRRLLRLHGRQHHGLREAGREGDVRRLGGARLREGGSAARRPGRAQPGAGEAGGGAGRRHGRRRDRAGRRPARGGRAGLPRARRTDPRPAGLGRGPDGRGRHRAPGGGVPAPALRRRVGVDPARGAGARAARGRRHDGGAAQLAARQPGPGAGAAARRQGDAAGDRGAQRRAVARAAQDQAGQRPDHPQQGARGDPAGAGARGGALAHRVLRRLQPPGDRGGRLDGGLRGRARRARGSTAGSSSAGSRARTTWPRCTR